MASICSPTFNQAATTGCVVDFFKRTGIVLWNPDIFSDLDFLVRYVTEREDSEDNQNIPSDSQNLSGTGANASYVYNCISLIFFNTSSDLIKTIESDPSQPFAY